MKKHALVLTLLLCLSYMQVGAQDGWDRWLTIQRSAKTNLHKPTLFTQHNFQAKDQEYLTSLLYQGIKLELDLESLQGLNEKKPEAVQLHLPWFGAESLDLELYPHALLDEDFQLLDSEGGSQPRPPGLFYRGVLANDPDSWVAFSVFPDEVMAVIASSRHGNIVLGKLPGKSSQSYVLYRDRDLIPEPGNDCETLPIDSKSMESVFEPPSEAPQEKTGAITYIRIWLEAEHDLVQAKNGAVPTFNFLAGLFNATATLYQREDIQFRISRIFAWTTPDHYATNSRLDALKSFRAYRNEMGYEGDFAHLVSYGAPRSGGIAFTNALCRPKYAYAYSYLTSLEYDFPLYSWAVNVLTHETGHNLGSPHTHDCAWNGDNTPIDGCGTYYRNNNPTCNTGPIPNAGTIMSYCHMISGIGIDFTIGFGEQPGDLIRSRIKSASCLATLSVAPCLQLTVAKKDNTCDQTSVGSIDLEVAGGEKPYYYNWSNGAQSASLFGLRTGDYWVTVTDSLGCVATQTISITEPLPIELSAKITDVSAPGIADGAILLTPENAKAPYRMMWSNGQMSQQVDDVPAGSYFVLLLDANGCRAAAPFEVGVRGCDTLITDFTYRESFEDSTSIWAPVSGTLLEELVTGPADSAEISAYDGSRFIHFPEGRTEKLLGACFDWKELAQPVLQLNYYSEKAGGGLMIKIVEKEGDYRVRSDIVQADQGGIWNSVYLRLSEFAGRRVEIQIESLHAEDTSAIGLDNIVIQDVGTPHAAFAESVTPYLSSNDHGQPFGIGSLQDLEVYPNPVRDRLNIEFISAGENRIQGQLTDVYGQVLWQRELEVTEGTNRISFQPPTGSGNLLFLVLYDGTEQYVRKVMVAP